MRAKRLFYGMLAGNALGALTILLATGFAMLVGQPLGLFIIWPSLVLAPFAVGVVAAWVWKPLDLSISGILLHSLSSTLLGVSAAFFLGSEGIVCLIIGAPILYIGTAAGALTGRVWFNTKRDRLNLCMAPILILAVAAEPGLRGSHRGVVTDEIRISAPPSKVWPHVLAFPEIPDAPDYWLFRVGLPYPTETTNGGNFIGADRACKFSGDAVFKEKIAEFVPERLLTFDIIESPPDPELLGHLDTHRGQFELRDNGDGTTTLIGRTWYSLHVHPSSYFDWWTHDIFRAVHLRVMKHVKLLSESES
jgi:hypothetical protein